MHRDPLSTAVPSRRAVLGAAGIGLAAVALPGCNNVPLPGKPKAGLDQGWSATAAVDELAELPFDPSTPMKVYSSDLAAIDRVTGKPRGTRAGDEANLEWLKATFSPNQSRFVGEVYLTYGPDAWDELGFSIIDVQHWVAMESPLQSTMIVHGAKVTPKADLPEQAPGVKRLGPAQDGALDIGTRTKLRNIGQGLRVAQRGSTTIVTPRTPVAVTWKDRQPSGDVASPLRQAAAALDRHKPVSVALLPSDRGQGVPITRAFEAVGLGWPAKPDGDTTALATYGFADAAAASAAVSEIRTAWQQGEAARTTRVVDVTAEDRDVVVRLHAPRGLDLIGLYERREAPFVHG